MLLNLNGYDGGGTRAAWPNDPVLVTAARLRFGMNLKGLDRAAARDGWR